MMFPPTIALTATLFLSSIPLSLSAIVPSRKAADPCAKIAGLPYAQPADILACFRAFPYNNTLKYNILSVVSTTLDFYTFEAQALNAPPPFQESTVNLRKEIARINATTYPSDYDFNKDLWDTINHLNDGHTLWVPLCYRAVYQMIIPAPIVSLEVHGIENIYIIPNLEEVINKLGTNFTSYYDSIGFDWKKYAGALVLEIEGTDPYSYVDHIASTVSGNFLDHNVRVNSVMSSYRLVSGQWGQRVGDLAGRLFPTLESLTMKVVRTGTLHVERVTFPARGLYLSKTTWSDTASYWAANCAVQPTTNGQNNLGSSTAISAIAASTGPVAKLLDDKFPIETANVAPSLPVQGGGDVVKAYILPDSNVGVLMIASFSPASFFAFQQYTVDAINKLTASGVKSLIIDVTNNGGGYVCLSRFLHTLLVGTEVAGQSQGDFQSTLRSTPLVKKLLEAEIKNPNIDLNVSALTADNFAFLNGTSMSRADNYFDPDIPMTINGMSQPTSQRMLDACTSIFNVSLPAKPTFDTKNIVIVGNGNCASTCALFTTVMHELYATKMMVFGGKPGEPIEYKGMAGNQVLEWADLNSEFLTSGVKSDPLAPPDLLVNGNIRHNFRTAYSWLDESTPIAFRSDPAERVPYTWDTYANPENLWKFVAGATLLNL